jgi:hypothetical protein
VAITIGVDIGQRRDPTAVCVAEGEWREVEGRTEAHHVVRHLERLPPGTPYPEVVERIAQITDQVRARSGERPTVFVDATGVGGPVVDLLRERVQGGEVVPVTFMAGDQRTESWQGDHLRVSLGKSLMVSRLQAMLGSGRLHLPRTQEAGALTRELLNFELRVDQSGHETSGAFRTGTHDDLVCALGLATQLDPVQRPLARTSPEPSRAR